MPEDIEPDTHLEDKDTDDSDLSIQTLVTAMTEENIPSTVGTQKNRTLISLANAKNNELNAPATEPSLEIPKKAKKLTPEEGGRGKRTNFSNKMYDTRSFWRQHNNKNKWDNDSILSID